MGVENQLSEDGDSAWFTAQVEFQQGLGADSSLATALRSSPATTRCYLW